MLIIDGYSFKTFNNKFWWGVKSSELDFFWIKSIGICAEYLKVLLNFLQLDDGWDEVIVSNFFFESLSELILKLLFSPKSL